MTDNSIHKALLSLVKNMSDEEHPYKEEMGLVVSTIGLALTTHNMHYMADKCSKMSKEFMDDILDGGDGKGNYGKRDINNLFN